LFDAVSALTGTSPLENDFEAEAAMRLEAAASSRVQASYPFVITKENRLFRISFTKTIKNILADLDYGLPPRLISSKFHNTLARVIVVIAQIARKESGIDTVVLCGGVFCNKRLLSRASDDLERKRFKVLRPVVYSPNDESLSVGQIAHALARLREGKGLSL
jgi:hydrogenase maturation protein HypF